MAKYNHQAECIRHATRNRPEITEKKMFGGLAFFLHGNMLCGVDGKRYMFRVGKNQENEALQKPGASPMDITGRPLGGLIYVKKNACDENSLKEWLKMAERFVGALPPKIKKTKASSK